LARAERVLEDQKRRPLDGWGFSDFLPYVLDRCAALWSVLNKATGELRGQHDPLNVWVRTILGKDPEVAAMRKLRGIDLHDELATAYPRVELEGGGIVLESSLSVVDENGRVLDEVRAAAVISSPTQPEWRFGYDLSLWDGRPVLGVVEEHLRRWREDILPDAERRIMEAREALVRHSPC
jgi:hypothetical protein